MTPVEGRVTQRGPGFDDEESRWRAVVDRDPGADGAFVFAVRTTGVYCRPSCRSRAALRRNVAFYESPRAAEAAGYRPCKRCRPDDPDHAERLAALVARACRTIEEADEAPTLDDLAAAAGMDRYHFHRLFKGRTGLTPRQYAAASRARRVRDELPRSPTVAAAAYRAGYGSSSRFYEATGRALGMNPGAFRDGGRGESIRFAVAPSSLGRVLAAAAEKGVCAILLGHDPDELAGNLRSLFPRARIVPGDGDFETLLARVVAFVEDPAVGLDLPLDVRGTAFQRRVWEALRKIPAGSSASYREIAEALGSPRAVRAVARACAANRLAVAIPCHRVLRADGTLSGYRWGVDRKAELLRRERESGAGG